MRLLLPLAAFGLLLSTAAVHPQDFGPDDRPPPPGFAPPPGGPEPDGPALRRMVCLIDAPAPLPQHACPTYPGYPGSPCRCAGSPFEGVRDFED